MHASPDPFILVLEILTAVPRVQSNTNLGRVRTLMASNNELICSFSKGALHIFSFHIIDF
jgi:hypothetical protein